MKELRIRSERPKERLIGTRHPYLGAEPGQHSIKTSAPRLVDMSGHFIHEKDRSRTPGLSHGTSVRQDKPDQKGLLLAGRALRRSRSRRSMNYQKITPVRTLERAAGGAVSASRISQNSTIFILRFHCWHNIEETFDFALNSDAAPRKRLG